MCHDFCGECEWVEKRCDLTRTEGQYHWLVRGSVVLDYGV